MSAKKVSLNSESVHGSYYAGIFLVSLSTLLLEFTYTRILSVSLWYHFAFMIISVALLGFGVSGVVLSLNKKLKQIKTDKLLTFLSMFFGISVILSFIIMNQIPFDPFSLLTDPVQFIFLPIYYLLITVPFFFSGLIISVLLTKFKAEVSRLYFFDLIGAGLSCFAFVLFMPMVGGNGTIVFIAMLGFICAIIFGVRNYKNWAFAAFVLILISSSFLINKDERFAINSTPNKVFGNYIKERPDLKVLTEWNTISKIDVMRDEQESPDGYNVYLAIIDNGNASTNIPNVKTLPPETRPADASNLAFAPLDSVDKTFIIGSAGGGEILSSLYNGSNLVIGVEINGILNDLIKRDLVSWTGPLVKGNDKVKLITDDARSVIRSKRIAYDVIISAHTISASAVSSGAMSMVENYILTQEAVEEYLEHLSPGGVLYISRPETQLPKLIATLKKARLNTSKGLEQSKDNFIVFRRPPNDFESDKSFMAGIIYKKDGFDYDEIVKVKNEAALLSINIEYDPLSDQEGIYRDLIKSDNIDAIIENYSTNIEPATDNKPYFDNNIGFSHLTLEGIKETFAQDEKGILALKDRPVAESTLIAILLQTIIIAGLLILLPLRRLTKEDKGKFSRKFLIYFGCLGAGYIMLQVCMIQKFTLFLGQPVYTLLTVVATMLVSSGLGSMFSMKFFNFTRSKLIIIFGIIAVLSIAIGLLNPLIFDAMVRVDLIWRVVISALIIAPLGFFMGMPFPIGLSLIEDDERNFAAFAWGINGFFSVIGTVITVMLSMMTGFVFIFILVAVIYLIALYFVNAKFSSLKKSTV
ncbi:MAG: hypothetical protein KDC42_04675 [Ignavibacteriae bacterium]|nr:hypothetical protein [Ignavibacteriota bacterium]